MSEPESLSGVWEERWHPLREEWVIVAGHRQDRPWSGESLEHARDDRAFISAFYGVSDPIRFDRPQRRLPR